MELPDYEIVASTENTPYLLWQALLFHASCVETQGVAPTIVVHGDGPLLAGFRALSELGVRVLPAPSYRMSDGGEYTCRNTAGSLLEAVHDRPWTLICDPDFLFLEPLPKTAESVLRGRAVSWDAVSYMQVGAFNRRWLIDACIERGIDPARVDNVEEGGVVPNFVRKDVHEAFAPRWISAVDTLVRVARQSGDVPWVTIAWGFALAAWELGLDLALTRLTDTNFDGAIAPESSRGSPILHYCYGDLIFDKRRHRSSDTAARLWMLESAGSSISASLVQRLREIRDWYSERGLDVADPLLYGPLTNAPPRPTSNADRASETSDAVRYLDELMLCEAAVGYGSLGTHGSLGYENKQVTVGGEAFVRALSSHAPARLVFELGGRYERFRSGVALNDDVPSGSSHADFMVFADGQSLDAAVNVVPGAPRTLEADVRGIQRLELKVETTRWEYCHAVWLDPQVERGESPPPDGIETRSVSVERA